MKRNINFTSLIGVNLIVFFSLIITIDLFWGDWIKSKPNVSKVPAALWNKNTTYDVSGLYGSKEKIYTNYTRDEKGYRGLKGQTSKLQILTIGGSTTDQRFLSDLETWHSFLEKSLPNNFNVINGGVDGQSTYGHLFSIKHWHSQELSSYKIPLIIFYLGANDLRLLNQGSQGLIEYDNLYQGKSLLRKIRIALSRNSFLYKRIRNIKNRIFNLTGASKDGIVWAGHYLKYALLSDPGIFYNIPDPQNKPGYNYYIQLVKDLVLETRKSFPNSKILIVQQTIPPCRFVNEKSVWNLHANHSKQAEEGENYCIDVGQVFMAQDRAIYDMKPSIRPSVVKFYLQDILNDDSIYDYMHHNQKGSKQISEALIPVVKKILQIH